MKNKDKLLRYLTYFAIIVVVVFIVSFIEATDRFIPTLFAIEKVGFLLFLFFVIFLIVRSCMLENLEQELKKEKESYYIFRFHKGFSRCGQSINVFLEYYEMDIDRFERTVVEPSIERAIWKYREENPISHDE